jgi:hypothetical protein
VIDGVSFWNEQYLLEAFLTQNPDWNVLLAVNYMKHSEYSLLSEQCACLDQFREPGSFYIQKIV